MSLHHSNHTVYKTLGQLRPHFAEAISQQLDTIALRGDLPSNALFETTFKDRPALDLSGRKDVPLHGATPRNRLHSLRELCFCKVRYNSKPSIKITGSQYVVTFKGKEPYILLFPHPKYSDLLLPTGGHADSTDKSFVATALRERKEELAACALNTGKVLEIPERFLPRCPLTGRLYNQPQLIFDIGCTWDKTSHAIRGFDLRMVEFISHADISRSYPHTHEDRSKSQRPDFKFYSLKKLCAEAANKPQTTYLAEDPTYYQRFICLAHFLTLARKTGQV